MSVVVFRRRCGKVHHSKHGPDDPCVLVGDCDRGSVEAAPLPKVVDPGTQWVVLVWGGPDDCPRSVDEQCAQMLVSALGDVQHDSLVAT